MLENRAKNDDDWGVRRVAVQRLADLDLVVNRARCDESPRVREAAVLRVESPMLLREIEAADPDEAVRAAAAQRLAEIDAAGDSSVNAGRGHRPGEDASTRDEAAPPAGSDESGRLGNSQDS